MLSASLNKLTIHVYYQLFNPPLVDKLIIHAYYQQVKRVLVENLPHLLSTSQPGSFWTSLPYMDKLTMQYMCVIIKLTR